MSLLIFAYRRQALIRRKAEINEKLMAMSQKLMDLQSYTTCVGNGQVSFNDLVNAPASMFGPMSIFMMTSNQVATQGANEKMNVLNSLGAFNQQTQNMQPQMAGQYQQYMFNQLKQSELEKVSKAEEKRLNLMDKQIEQQKAKLETELKMVEAEETSVKEGEDKGAKDSAPKYVA